MENEDSDNKDLYDAVYKGVTPKDPEHESAFGADPGKSQHFTVEEGQTFDKKDE